MMNKSILELNLKSVLLTSPSFIPNGGASFTRCSFSMFSSPVSYSRMSINNLFHKCDFSHFLTSAIINEGVIFEDSIYFAPLPTHGINGYLSVVSCRFRSVQSTNGAIYFVSKTHNGSVNIRKTSFFRCWSNQGTSCVFSASHYLRLNIVCFEECGGGKGETGIMKSISETNNMMQNVIYSHTDKRSGFHDSIVCSSQHFESKNNNFSNIMSKFTSGFSAFCPNQNTPLLATHFCIYVNASGSSLLSIKLFSEVSISRSLFYMIKVKNAAILAENNQIFYVGLSSFKLVNSSIIEALSSKPDFNTCYFDSVSSKYISQMHLDNCETNINIRIDSYLVTFDSHYCWAPPLDFSNVGKKISIWNLVSVVFWVIFAVVVSAIAIRLIRKARLNEFSEREVLERLNVFEGEDNPQIKMMLMDARDGLDYRNEIFPEAKAEDL